MRGRERRRGAEIDITPLIDVLFMLIIFFVLTASFVQGMLDVTLPQGEGESSEASGAVVVTVTADKKLYWEGREIDRAALLAVASANREREILIAGDEGAMYGDVAEVLALLRSGGVSSAGLLLSGGNAE